MNDKVKEVMNTVKEKTPELIKDNKGALIGAVVGLFLTNNKEAQSSLLGAIAGSLLVDSKKEDK